MEPVAPQLLLQQALSFHAAGRLDEAQAVYRQVLSLDPEQAGAWNLLGVVAHQQGRYAEALDFTGRAIRLRPDVADFYANHATALRSTGAEDRAADALNKALAMDPRCLAALAGLAQLRTQQNRLDDAERLLRVLTSAHPSAAAGWISLGQLLASRGKFAEAHGAYASALRVSPGDPPAISGLGMLLHMQHRYEDAVTAFQAALRSDPASAAAMSNLAGAFVAQGRVAEASETAGALLSAHPDDASAASLLLMLAHYTAHDRGKLLAEHIAWADRYAPPPQQPSPPAVHVADSRDDADPDRRLRVGYVSADFRRHPVTHFIEPLLLAHDRAAVEIYCYSDVARPDDATQRLERRADQWRAVADLSDEQFCARVRGDGIDVLVELSGHTAGNRLAALAARPAPVQVSYLGYPDTTGLSAIDYRITDALADPDGDEFYAERLVRLPRCAWCYRPPDPSPHPGTPPARRSGGAVTFGSFNAPAKLSDETIDLWSKVLAAVPGSKLLIKAAALGEAPTRERFAARFAGRGIASDRLVFRGHDDALKHHLRTYHEIDIALDTFPYHGTTTTCDALWMGVPVVTLAGTSHVSRVGASLLNAVVLDELITSSPDQFVRTAVDLAADVPALAKRRSTLRAAMQKSPLMDAAGFARAMENAYREMWRSRATPTAAPAR